jgi:hypothetical protein
VADFNEFILEITVLHHIYCRDGQPAEVLPFPVSHDGAFWGFYWWGQRPENLFCRTGRGVSSAAASSQAVVDAEAQEPAAAEQELAHLSVDDLIAIARLPYIPALGRDGTAAWLRESGRT